jgi:hypothetical protein
LRPFLSTPDTASASTFTLPFVARYTMLAMTFSALHSLVAYPGANVSPNQNISAALMRSR